jgi:hypothetical protein
MKNLKFLFGAIAMVLVFLIACEDEKSNPVAENGTATISGIAYVNFSELNDTNIIEDWNYEYVPTGTTIYAKLNSEDLVLVPNDYATYADIYIETTVGANGTYSFSVPANSKNFTVEISGNDFLANFVQVGIDTLTIETKFTLNPTYVYNIHNGAVRIENLYFE